MELLASGKATALSTGGLGMSERVEQILHDTPNLRDHLVIRNGDITNSAEVIGRLGLVALNTGIEIDIYGNVNSSHIAGSRVVNGIGGGAGFAQNAGLSVILIPSTAKGGAISNIVPMASHQDIGEHDVDVVVTEHGIADLRGLDDGERADAIVTHCASEAYRGQLTAYLQTAREQCGGHHPQLPEAAFGWYRRLEEEGTMLESGS
jgi:acyl-CoA hydrolase